jgi:hypothetical protein
MNTATSKGDPFQQQEESKSKPFKVVVNLEYTEKQYKEGVGKISVYYEDSDGFKKTKTYDFDEIMHMKWSTWLTANDSILQMI